MVTLDQLPDDCLHELSHYLPSDTSFVKLWLTGSKSLIEKLQRTKNIALVVESSKPILWPSNFFLRFPFLESLTFAFSRVCGKGFSEGTDLWNGSNKLQKLSIRGPFKSTLFALPLANLVPCLTELYLEKVIGRDYMWVAALPPHLRRLELLQIEFDPLIIWNALPASLERLRLDFALFAESPETVEWPCNLVSLTFAYQENASPFFKKLPPTLTHLEVDGEIGENGNDDIIPLIPSSVTHLTLRNCPIGQGLPKPDSLPPAVTHLELQTSLLPNMDEQLEGYWNFLNRLERLKVWSADDMEGMELRVENPDAIWRLQKRSCPVKYGFFALMDIDGGIELPEAMESLRLTAATGYLPRKFPPALRDLEVYSVIPLDLLLQTPLPPWLTRLRLHGSFPEDIPDGYFPATLRTIQIRSTAFRDSSIGFAALPNTLSKIEIQDSGENDFLIYDPFFCHPTSARNLPTGLQYLHIRSEHNTPQLDQWLLLLPTTLPLLELDYASAHQASSGLSIVPMMDWPNFPPTLRSLTISVTQFRPSVLKKLPPRLRQFRLIPRDAAPETIKSEHIALLPSSITDIGIPCDASVTDTDFRRFGDTADNLFNYTLSTGHVMWTSWM